MARRKAGQPTTAEIEKLVADLGRYVGAGLDRPGIKVEQRLYDRYRKSLSRLQARYPDIDLESSGFHDNLRDRAIAWWKGRAIRGSGVDW